MDSFILCSCFTYDFTWIGSFLRWAFHSKNVLSVLAQNFGIACLMSVVWVVIGYSIAFPTDSSFFGDLSKIMLRNTDGLVGTIPEKLFIVFK